MAANKNLGVLEEQVILAVQALGKNAYGMSVTKKLEDAGAGSCPSAIYTTLERLKDKGLLAQHEQKVAGLRGERIVFSFRVTQKGVAALSKAEAIRAYLKAG